jgi:methylated-DNA-[protein]-cysteine S-methyltransferase
MTAYTLHPSPIGTLLVAGEGRRLEVLAMQDGDHPFGVDPDWTHDPAALAPITEQLDEYFAGERTEFDVELDAAGSEFQHRVWDALCAIPYGETTSYGAIARELELGAHGARAVGMANGSNPIAVVVPCHRVIGADGSLTGYGGGLPRKRLLLDLEAKVAGRTLV